MQNVAVIGGWFDAEDRWGTLAVYHAAAESNPAMGTVPGGFGDSSHDTT